jgi:hypothetical protein
VGRLADLIARDFGGPIDALYNRELSAVGTTTVRVFRLDADRVGALIVNLSSAKVYAGPFLNVSATKGILLGPNGGQLVLTYDEEFLTVGAEWYLRSSKANCAIFTVELVAQASPTPAGV